MKYHLYYHDDFDGMASGAVMLNFLRSRGDDIISYNPIDYTPQLNENWVSYKFKKPFILVDFRYHPAADWWFDHHETSFDIPALSSWKKLYRKARNHYRNSSYDSCCSLVTISLKKYHKYYPPRHTVELSKWLDVIDGAKYKLLKEVIESVSPPLKLRNYLFYEKDETKREKLVQDLAFKPMSEIARQKRVVEVVKNGETQIKKALKMIKNHSAASGNTVFIDATPIPVDVSHYMAYYVYPKSKYSVILEKVREYYHLGIGFNFWQSSKKPINVGNLMVKYGGGGRKTVGAIEKKSKSELLKIAKEVIKYLNRYG